MVRKCREGWKMKRWMGFGAAAILSLTLCLVFGGLLLACMRPMEDKSYDLSLQWEGEAMPEDWVYDQKGWTVFTQEGGAVKELAPDGLGGFSGLDAPGQTFYFSRVLTEEMDSPILRVDMADRTFALFLDGNLVYTDCPELDNRMGYLRLPMLDGYRDEQVLVALPEDYLGKTLTVAQSTDPYGGELQGPATKVWPCAVTLYCGYAYKSVLIADSFRAAVPAALCFVAGASLLALFVLQVFRETPDPGVLCGGLTAFFWLAGRLDFLPNAHLVPLPVDVAALSRDFSLTLLLVFLSFRLKGWKRILVWLSAGAQGGNDGSGYCPPSHGAAHLFLCSGGSYGWVHQPGHCAFMRSPGVEAEPVFPLLLSADSGGGYSVGSAWVLAVFRKRLGDTWSGAPPPGGNRNGGGTGHCAGGGSPQGDCPPDGNPAAGQEERACPKQL
jgi:hypothetical protein